MQHSSCHNEFTSIRGEPNTRFVDLHNQPKPRWRDALAALMGPAMRVHNYRNLHKGMFYEAVCDIDCKDDQ